MGSRSSKPVPSRDERTPLLDDGSHLQPPVDYHTGRRPGDDSSLDDNEIDDDRITILTSNPPSVLSSSPDLEPTKSNTDEEDIVASRLNGSSLATILSGYGGFLAIGLSDLILMVWL